MMNVPTTSFSTRRASAYDFLQNRYSDLKVSCVFHWTSRFHLLIWIIGFFAMLGLTIHDFMPLLDEYKHNNFASQTTVKIEAMSPNFTICIPQHLKNFYNFHDELFKLDEEYLSGNKSMAGVCDLCQAMKEHHWDFWNYKNRTGKLSFDNLDPETTISESFIPRLLRDGLNETMLNFDKFPWMRVILDGLWYYFAWSSWTYVNDYKILTTEDYLDPALTLESLRKNKKISPYISREDLDGLVNYFLKGIEKSIEGGCMVRQEGKVEKSATLTPLKLKSFKILNHKICFDLPDNFEGCDFVCSYSAWPQHWQRYAESKFEIYLQ